MPVPKLKLSSTADAMKHDEGNDSLDTLIRQAIGKEPFLSFSRAGDSPLQWIQLLHALDQQDLPGWPLLSPLKMQMQKCEKCSREFCSTINYRRHMRLHRRNLNLDKDSTMKTKDLLRGFWDKLGADEAMEILSFKDVYLEEVTGSSIIKALTSFIRIASIPHSYVKAGSALLDIVQAGPSRFPVLSADLFSILDDASERTFLCAGTAESLQKYVFDGEAGKIGLEMRNLVACTSFLVEQKLVKAWVADKDAEALRYQKLLVEEEEAAQRRQAALLEKKRQKKLRLKEQKAKEHANGEIADSPEDISSMDSPPDLSVSSPFEASDSSLDIPDIPDDQTLSSSERDRVLIMEEDANTEPQSCLDTGYPDSGAYQNVEHGIFRRNGRRNLVNSRWHASKLQRVHNGFPGSHSHQVTKLGIMQKHSSYHDQRTANAANVYKIWTPKPKSETNEENYKTRLQIEPEALPDQNKTAKVIIGSISIALRDSSTQQRDKSFGSGPRNYGLDAAVEKNSSYEKPVKCDAVQGIANRSTVKLWRPVSRENGSSIPVRNGSDGSEVDDVACKDGTQILGTSPTYCNCNECEDSLGNGLDEVVRQEGVRFSRHVAEAFLSQRWKEAIASDHVRLVLFPEAEPPGDPAIHDDSQAAPPSEVSQCDDQGHTQNNSAGFVSVEPSASAKPKTKLKPDKGTKVKYIPKQKS